MASETPGEFYTDRGEMMCGSSVLLSGLQSARYNGFTGVIITEADSQAPDGRRNVQISDNSVKAVRIKEDNLQLICSDCGKLEPQFRCR